MAKHVLRTGVEPFCATDRNWRRKATCQAGRGEVESLQGSYLADPPPSHSDLFFLPSAFFRGVRFRVYGAVREKLFEINGLNFFHALPGCKNGRF